MDSAIFKYVDSSGATQSRTIQVSLVKGFEEPDLVAFFPQIQNNFVDGTIETQFQGFRRVITFDCGVLSSRADRLFVQRFLTANTRSVSYQAADIGIEEIIVSHDYNHNGTAFEYDDTWINDSSLGKQFILYLVENAIRNVWSSYTPASGVDYIYIAYKIKVTGTQASPQTFQTNAGTLTLDATGKVFPAMSLLTWAVTIAFSPYQDGKINRVGAITNVGTDISFQLAISDGGAPSGDGFFYTDIIIGLEAI